MKHKPKSLVDISQNVHTLRHIETGEYICLRQNGQEYMACFTDGDSAYQFREELGLLEHVNIERMALGETPFEYFWLDGEMISRAVLTDRSSRPLR
jgi:hypothetical protein